MTAPNAYVQLPFTTDPNDLADSAIAFLQTQWSGWTPEDGDLSVVMLEALAPMAANAAQIAANMPPAALIALGTKLLGIPYQAGVPATATATFTVSGSNGTYDIPSGSEIDIGGAAFQTTADLQVTISNGTSNTGSVLIAANDPGTFANGFDGTNWTPVNLPVFVTAMTLGANTTGGVDPQDDQDYLNSIALELQLRAQSIITLVDYEIVAVNTAGIGRAVAIGQSSHPRNIDVYVTDDQGNAVSSTIKTALATTYAGARMINAVITVNDPGYTTVNVTYELLAKPGVNTTALQATCNSALDQELSPAGWGAPTGATAGLTWVDQPTVHVNRLIGVLSGVTGVDYVKTLSLSGSPIASLSSLLSTGGPITSLPVNSLPNSIANTTVLTLTDPTGAHTQTWTTTSAVSAGGTAISVVSQTPNYAYPSGSTLAGGVIGDLIMNGNASGALPKAGTMTGTIDAPAT